MAGLAGSLAAHTDWNIDVSDRFPIPLMFYPSPIFSLDYCVRITTDPERTLIFFFLYFPNARSDDCWHTHTHTYKRVSSPKPAPVDCLIFWRKQRAYPFSKSEHDMVNLLCTYFCSDWLFLPREYWISTLNYRAILYTYSYTFSRLFPVCRNIDRRFLSYFFLRGVQTPRVFGFLPNLIVQLFFRCLVPLKFHSSKFTPR